MRSQRQYSERAVRRAGDKELHGNCSSSVLFVCIEAAWSQRLCVNKRPQMKPAVRIDKMQPHRRRVRMVAVLRRRVVWRTKPRARHAQMKRAEHRHAHEQSRSYTHRPAASALIRGSTQYNSKSATKFPTTRNKVDSSTPPITTYKSRARIASSKNGPSPGQLITTSTRSDPLSSVPRLNPKSAISGCAAAGSAYRYSNRLR